MVLQLSEIAPDFEADTTEGRISFHDWIGESWAVLLPASTSGDPATRTGSVSDEEAAQIFGEWNSPRPYIRVVPQPA